MTDSGHCMHTSYIDTLREEARREFERAEDYRDSCRLYKTIVEWVLLDIRDQLLGALTIEEAHAEARKLQTWVTNAARHLP